MGALAFARLLLAVFRAFPSIEKLAEFAVRLSKEVKRAKALRRKNEKDKAVDNAIDGVRNP